MRMTDTKDNRWYAEQDFDLKNLIVVKGELLPKKWQAPGSIRYLKQNFGEGCVIWTKNRSSDGNGKDEKASELEILKVQMQEMQNTINQLKVELEKDKPKEVKTGKRKLTRKASIE